MSSSARKILDDTMGLPAEQRRIMAEALLHSVSEESEHEIHPAWRDEVMRRIGQVQRGEVGPGPWSEVRAKLRQAIGR